MKNTFNLSPVEQILFNNSGIKETTTNLPYIIASNFPQLGMYTALRFIEWAVENPDGVISLPTGKTPEHFIKWTQHIIANWNTSQIAELREYYNLKHKPALSGLQFVQIDEFYPISSKQHNSFYHYVNEFYIKGFGLNPTKALLINCDKILLAEGKHFAEIFPNSIVDLSLRYRAPINKLEQQQQQSVFMIDDWCKNYEAQIREKGGIGFFLGGIGPDGHIAFNTRGSDHFSTTRLTATNFETQAVAAGDLGGIDVSRNRLVITIGLNTITYNPKAVAIIFAAGEAKGNVVADALQNKPDVLYPATALQKLPNARFYLTKGAAYRLNDTINNYYAEGAWTHAKSEHVIIGLCKKLNKFGSRITEEDLREDKFCNHIPNISNKTVESVIESIELKLEKGCKSETGQTFLHTGPHHDDIMLGIMPHVNRQLRSASNNSHFAVMTSGFTAVTNSFVIDLLTDTLNFIKEGKIEMLTYPDFFTLGFNIKRDKDVYHYLGKVASGDSKERRRGLCHRVVRDVVDIWKIKEIEELKLKIKTTISDLKNSYDGEKNTPEVQKLKGMIREFEEELVWAHFGVQLENVHHLRLGFYTGDIFTELPERKRDVQPILKLIEETNPTVISLALDPEGSGPDTHYKVLQAIAEAIRLWKTKKDLSNLRVWGYRNVWYKFHPSEVNVIVPVSLNALALLNQSFEHCYLSQANASFPSYQYDGKFSELTQKVWVEQLKEIQLLLGKDYFYQNKSPLIRATHGLIYLKEMDVEEFLDMAIELEKSMEGVVENQ